MQQLGLKHNELECLGFPDRFHSKWCKCYTKWILDGFGRIFEQTGYTGLKTNVTARLEVSFAFDDKHLPRPRIGFFTRIGSDDRHEMNVKQLKRIPRKIEANREHMFTFLSMANFYRNRYERGSRDQEHMLSMASTMYIKAVGASGNKWAIAFMKMVLNTPDEFVLGVAHDTDGIDQDSVPVDISMAVAEALAGLSLISAFKNQVHHAVSFAVGALHRHESALPFINGVRIVSMIALAGYKTVLFITQYAILPYYQKIQDAKSYQYELNVWSEDVKKWLVSTQISWIETALCADRQTHDIVGRGVFRKSKFIKKTCVVCGKGGSDGEKTKACARCSMVYYCGKECQKAHWPEHKKECRSAAC